MQILPNFFPKKCKFWQFFPKKVQILKKFSHKSENLDNWKLKIEGNFFTHRGKNNFFWQNINLWAVTWNMGLIEQMIFITHMYEI